MTPLPDRETTPQGGPVTRVVAVVVTYDRPQELRQAVHALVHQSRPPDHIIVFDNGGAQAEAALREFRGRVEIVHSRTNLGGAGGFARGLAQALERGADWVWLLDDDAIPTRDALASLLASPQALAPDTGALCSAVQEFGCWAPRHHRRFDQRTGWEGLVQLAEYRRNQTEIDAGSFVGFLVSARAARAIGLPNAAFFLAYDDTDYSLRLGRAGWRLWLIPHSVVVHLRNPRSRLRTGRFGAKHYYNIRNRLIVKRRYARWRPLATCECIGYGLILWGLSGGWKSVSGWRLLHWAFRDGLAGRLGHSDN